MLRATSTLCIAASLLASATALANGRFPRAERLLEDSRDTSHLILGATYGMLVTQDAGASWHHVCEASFAEADLQTDPVIALTSDGALLAGIYASVARSDASACNFQKTLGQNNREAVPDFTLATSVPGRAIGVLVSLLDDGTSQNQLYRSDDAGESWSPLGPLLPNSIRSVVTVDVAPSDPDRIYVSGLAAEDAGVLLRSDDGGQTYAAFPLPTDPVYDEVPYIAAVDPEDPDALYLRTDVWEYDPLRQVATANDALLYSSDGGAHVSELLRKRGKLFGFTFSPDGRELLVGYGDPVEAGGGRLTEPEALGIYRAAKGSSNFQKRYSGSVSCLTWSARGVYACTQEAETGFSLGLTANADFSLEAPPAFAPLLRLQDVLGPLECPACSSGSICRSYWESTCRSWGRTDCVSLIPTAPDQCGGAGGENVGGGAQAGAPATNNTALVASGSGCACRLGQAPGQSAAWWWLLLGLLRRRPASATARRAAGELRFGGNPACRTRTARAPAERPRHGPA